MEPSEEEQVNQVKEIIQYIVAGNKEAKHTTLDIILAYTATPEHRALFKTTECCKELLRVLPEPDMDAKLKVMKCLINFS